MAQVPFRQPTVGSTQLVAQASAVAYAVAGVSERVKSGSSPVVAEQVSAEQSPTVEGSCKKYSYLRERKTADA